MKSVKMVIAISILIMSGCAINKDQVAAQLYEESKVALYTSEVDLAASLIDSAITLNPLKANYYNIYGLVLSDQESPEEAISMYRQSIKMDTVLSPSKLIRLANEYGKLADLRRSSSKDYQAVCHEGISYFKEIYGSHPDLDDAFTCLGICYYALGEVDSAEYYLIAAIESNESKLYEYHKLGELYYSTLRLDEANTIFESALKMNKWDQISRNGIEHIDKIKTAFTNHENDPSDPKCLTTLTDELINGSRLVSSIGLPYQYIWEDELWTHLYELYLSN